MPFLGPPVSTNPLAAATGRYAASMQRVLVQARMRRLLTVVLVGLAPVAGACTSSPAEDQSVSTTMVATSGQVSPAASVPTSSLPATGGSDQSPTAEVPASRGRMDAATSGSSTAALPETGGGKATAITSSTEVKTSTVATKHQSRTTLSNSLPLPATTPVPPPANGGISQTVTPTRAATTLPTVPLSKTASYRSGIGVALVSIAPSTAKARNIGEVSGPALTITVKVTNNSDMAADISAVIVNVFDRTGAPCNQIQNDKLHQFGGKLAPGKSAEGQYQFTIAKDRRNPIAVQVIYAGGEPVAVFRGNAG